MLSQRLGDIRRIILLQDELWSLKLAEMGQTHLKSIPAIQQELRDANRMLQNDDLGQE